MIIALIGPPGSGKGTQADLVSKELNLFHFSTGEAFRRLKDPEIEVYLHRGDLVPDEKVIEVFEKVIESENLFGNLLIDGSPRSLYQYGKFKSFFEKHKKKIDWIIYIKISDSEALKRLTARREDKKTGKIYNLVTNPPDSTVNPNDLVTRDDDREEAVLERLRLQKPPEDMLSAIEKDGILIEVNGEKSIEAIKRDIISKLKNVEKQSN